MDLIIRPVTGHRKPPAKRAYEVYDGDIRVGHVYQTPIPDSTEWFWTLVGKVSDGKLPDCGLADTLDDALAQFKTA